MKDFFVSFNSADRSWGDWISWTLEEAGYQVFYQHWDFRPGENFILEMQRATTESRKVVLVLSDNYLKAEYTRPEWTAFFVDDPTGEQRKLIPLRVAQCQPTGLLKPLIYADLVGLTQDEAKEAVLLAVSDARPKPSQPPAFPGVSRGGSFGVRGIRPAPVFPGGPPRPTRSGRGGGGSGRALALWEEKLAFLEEQEALAADPNQKFSLKKQIEEAREKVAEHGGERE